MRESTQSSALDRYLPHRPPMILIEDILSGAKDKFEACVQISEGSFGYEEKISGVPSWFGFEYMAQTIAAYNGMHGSPVGPDETSNPEIGFLIGLRNYQVSAELFPIGARLEIQVLADLVLENSGSFQCKIFQDGRELASGHLTTYKPD